MSYSQAYSTFFFFSFFWTMPTAIIIGASTGIGRALAFVLAERGYALGLVARRVGLLEELRREIQSRYPVSVQIRQMDVAQSTEAIGIFHELVATVEAATGGMDVVIINAGVGVSNSELRWEQEAATIDVNVTGFAAIATAAMNHFWPRGRGHIVGISSMAALRGLGHNPAYAASKAFVSNYLQGLRHRAGRSGKQIYVTDIKPGFVETPMTAQNSTMFWVATAELAARQIVRAIEAKRKSVYVTRRWRLAGWAMRLMPDWLFNKI
jgi:short-subunit dehydrogenase